MTNNPLLHYKPGLTMDAPISVTMAAADWQSMMVWFSGLADETEHGVSHIIYGIITEQVSNQIYTTASIKGAEAHIHERHSTPPIVQFLQSIGVQFAEAQPTIFDDSDEIWVMRCGVCNSEGRYPPRHTGPLECGHTGSRNVTEIISRSTEQQEGDTDD